MASASKNKRLFRNINSNSISKTRKSKEEVNLVRDGSRNIIGYCSKNSSIVDQKRLVVRSSYYESNTENKSILSHFNKQTHIDEKLLNFTSRLNQIRSKTKSPEFDTNCNQRSSCAQVVLANSRLSQISLNPVTDVNIHCEQQPLVVDPIKIEEKSGDENKEIEESEVTTPSSKHSAIINTNEKKNAIEYGFSLDKRMPKCIPIYSDIQKTSFALAQAVLRHIKFSRGVLFLEDLALIMKNKEIQGSAIKRKNDIINKIDFSPSQNMLKFNYCFNDNLKFDLSVAKPKYLSNNIETIDEIK